MTWHERITTLVIIGVFVCGYAVGVSGRVDTRRARRLVERMGRERSPW